MARSGHLNSQSLQQIQSFGRAAAALSSLSSSKTFLGQKFTHIPHPLHHSLLMRCSFNFGFAIYGSSQIFTSSNPQNPQFIAVCSNHLSSPSQTLPKVTGYAIERNTENSAFFGAVNLKFAYRFNSCQGGQARRQTLGLQPRSIFNIIDHEVSGTHINAPRPEPDEKDLKLWHRKTISY